MFKEDSIKLKRIHKITQEEIIETYDITNNEIDFFMNEPNFFANDILVHNSQHAAGVLVSSDKLMENVALVKARKRIVTAWQEGSDYHELSDLGYYKYDILGLNNLQVVNDAHKLVKERRGVDIDWDSIDLNEEYIYKNVVQGHDHFGVFQYESNLARKLMKDIMPDNFEELSAVSSLLRPGPLRMGMHTEFADRKHGRKIEGKDYDIPECIREIVGYTYGVMCVVDDTVITTEEGELTIKEIVDNKLNLKVLSENEDGEKEWKEVENWFDNGIRDTITLELESGHRIECTPDHEIYTLNRGKIEAQYLLPDDDIVILNDSIKLKRIIKNKPQRVYDLTVKDNHNFFANGIKISNCYQEQFMQIATKIGGLTPAETNAFRKALVKYSKSAENEAKRYAQVASYHEKFITTASLPENLGDKLKAEEMWQLIAAFSAYGFNKSISLNERVQDKIRGIITLKEVVTLIEDKEKVEIKSADENGNEIWVEVLDTHDHGVLDLVEVELEDGKKIKCTMNHKFRTSEGMLPLHTIIDKELEIVVEGE